MYSELIKELMMFVDHITKSYMIRLTRLNRILDVNPCVNDPSAGSPTETLLRLLLPLSDKVYITSCTNLK